MTDYTQDVHKAAEALATLTQFLEAVDVAEPNAYADPVADSGLADYLRNNPQITAQLLMEVLGSPVASESFDVQQKRYWLEVAEYMGPDHVWKFKDASVFMSRIV